jgi:hypothetical protein
VLLWVLVGAWAEGQTNVNHSPPSSSIISISKMSVKMSFQGQVQVKMSSSISRSQGICGGRKLSCQDFNFPRSICEGVLSSFPRFQVPKVNLWRIQGVMSKISSSQVQDVKFQRHWSSSPWRFRREEPDLVKNSDQGCATALQMHIW